MSTRFTELKYYVAYHTASNDYEATSELLTFGPSVTTTEVSIPITNDRVYEPDLEQFLGRLGLVTPGVDVTIMPAEATVTINDDDGNVLRRT